MESQTNKKIFLEKIEEIIPWDEWLGIIKPCYYKGERGNKPYDLELMLRIYILQNLYDLSDMKVMMEVIGSRAFLEFCGVDSPRQVPDGVLWEGFVLFLRKTKYRKNYFHRLWKYWNEKN